MVKESNDEIGLIIEKMKELTQSLGSIVGKIRNSSDTMSPSAAVWTNARVVWTLSS